MKERIEKLQKLIDLFDRNIKQYKSNSYDESNTRIDFIDKFFELLDWDVRNTKESSEQYREVVREDKVIIKGKPKAPDYSFRVGRGQLLFFVEAKKPSVNIKEDIHPAFQIRRYAYSAKLPLSILTDFEEFAVYDTRIKPNPDDKASVGRVFYCTYKEYIDNFDFIYNTFSKPAVYKGSFDRYIEENKNKKGTSEVDKEFLKLIDTWRNELAKNIALRNKDLDVYNLNYAIQKIIDRIIFLRIAEDRHMEEYDNLKKICNSAVIYSTLDKYFQKANDKYNSGLFKVEEWLSKLEIDNKILSNIIKGLYYPDCPYEFSVLPIETLGNIYEQFLGKTIRLTQSHQAKVEDKPEVRKAGGVYYTPQYIVDYIVENTVGEKIKNKTPKQIEKLTILDPACGSGSFLVRAFKYLLDYHNDWHTKKENIKKAIKDENIYQVGENDYRLTIEEKQKILLNNIYGVDIDSQAVEVTKLSLLLKLLEGEGVQAQFDLFKHSDIKLLPDISNNIKCGNSLIGTDYYKDKNFSLFGTEEMRKVNAFDWNKEFPFICQNCHSVSPSGHSRPDRESNGFDVVIGNPPYGAELNNNERDYCNKLYNIATTDTAGLFIDNANKLTKNRAIIGLIIPKPFIYASVWCNLREKYLANLIKIIDVGKAWKEVKLEQILYFQINYKTSDYYQLGFRKKQKLILINKIKKEYCKKFGVIINGVSSEELKIGLKLNQINHFFNDVTIIKRGQDIQKYLRKNNIYKYIYRCKSISRYFLKNSYEGIEKELYLQLEDSLKYMEKPKIIIQNIVAHVLNPVDHIILMAYYDDKRIISLGSVGNIFIKDNNYHPYYLLGILNSRLISWYAYRFIYGKAIRTMRFDNVHLSKLPCYKIDFLNKKSKREHDDLVALVTQMLETQKQFHSAKTDNDKKNYQKKIEIIDQQIDDLVYKLYDLTEEEIKIIEEN